MSLSAVRRALRARADPRRARNLQGFFKTGPGEYGEGDVFIGLTVPQVRLVAEQFHALPLADLAALLQSSIHEERLLALIILTAQYRRAGAAERNTLYRFYVKHRVHVNNWDLVDQSAPRIVGEHLLKKPRGVLDRWAKSRNVWERRMAIVSTLRFIADKDYDDTLRIARLLLSDSHDLIHKATGWMLREVGKRDETVLRQFLARESPRMPRTTLRYAIERFTPQERARFLSVTRLH